jgi:hypothetical protein
MAMVASHKLLFTHYQKDGVDNHTYHRKFLAHVDTLKTYGGMGVVGVVPTFLSAKIKELAIAGKIINAAHPTDQERALTVSAVRDEYLAALMLSGANRDRFGELRTDLKNQFGYGDDQYLKMVDTCLALLNHWTPMNQPKSPRGTRTPNTTDSTRDKDKDDNEALVFAQDSKKPPGNSTANTPDDSSSSKSSCSSSLKKPTNVRCKTCGRLGHTLLVCPDSKPLAQIHAMTAEVDDVSVASTDFKVIILAQEGGHSSIDPNFLLLDSQSTVNLFSNPSFIDNVQPTARPIQVHCNKDIMPTSNIADFGSNEVYLNQDGIANVLLLHLLAKKHHITYNSCDRGGVFKVQTTGVFLEFKPTNKGLHALNLSNNPKAAHVLVTSTPPNDDHLHVNTVRNNYEGFTKKQVQHACEAHRIMLMTGVPTERCFECMVRLNQLQDCPITHEDIKIDHAIYNCNLANTRGK